MTNHPQQAWARLFCAVTVMLIATALASAAPEPAGAFLAQVFTNGSFEFGQGTPAGWIPRPAGRWETGASRSGSHHVSGDSSPGEVVWESAPIALQAEMDYRVEGWLRCRKGRARLAIEQLDRGGQRLQIADGPEEHGGGGWQYTALEWNSGKAAAARVRFWVKGKADLDDVSLSPVPMSFAGNKGVEADARNRLGFWMEEKTEGVLSGRRAGEHVPDSAVVHTGKTSARLTATGDIYAISTVNYGVPAWGDAIELSGWARCEGSAAAQLLACWTDDKQTVLRVDTGGLITDTNWHLLTLRPPLPPAGAKMIRLIAAAHHGRVWFDDLDLSWLRPQRRLIRVFANQVGYDRAGPKTAVIGMNFLPRDTDCPATVLTAEGKVAWQGSASCAGRINGGTSEDWGWYFWRVDFSRLTKPGSYRLATEMEEVRGESFPFQIGSGLLLRETAASAVNFFFVQRCGFEVPGWHKACHLDDAQLPDGTHIDATGGWHSAGDYNKLMYENGDGGVVFALLSAYQSDAQLLGNLDRDGDGLPDVLDEARWGAQFVAKMQIPENGGLRNHVHQGPGRAWTKWSIPDIHTDNTNGTPDDPVIQPGEGNSPLVIGAWAKLSTLLRDRGMSNDYLDRARRLWNHASKKGTEVGSPQLLLSALELRQVTGESAYLDYARRSATALLAQQVTTNRVRGAFGSYGELTAGALAQFVLDQPKDPLASPIKQALRAYIAFCVSTANNPFGLSKQSAAETAGFFPGDLGANFQVLMRAWAAGLVYRVTGERQAWDYATDHVDWVLGKNPISLCMFEGKGSLNPPRYHHRYNMIPGQERGAVPGTIPNGFVRDMGLADRPGFDLSRSGGRSPSFRTSEPWLVHDMWYLLAVSALNQAAR